MAKLAVSEALGQAKPTWTNGQNVALILSTLSADSRALEELYPEFMQDGDPDEQVRLALPLFSNGSLLNALGNHFALYGPRLVISNACASGNIALGVALDMIRLGRCRTAVIPGVELVKLSAIWGAERSGFIGRALRPFHRNRDGSILGEGAGALIVQHPDDVQQHEVLGWLEGFGCGVDMGAAAITLLADGSGLRRSMALSLADANRPPSDIEYINAHAPGTPLIDLLECQAVSDLFGNHAINISLNSTKSLTSHMSAASAIVEVVATLLQMHHGFLHPHFDLDEPDPKLPIEVIGTIAIERRVTRALSNACGGGGLNTSVVITAPSEGDRTRAGDVATATRRIGITGIGSVSALGAGSSDLFTQAPPPLAQAGPLEWFNIEHWYPKESNYSYMNRAAQLGAAAGYVAIADARLEGAYASDRIAVVSGTFLGGAPEASAVMCQGLMEAPDYIRPSMALDHGVHLSSALIRRHFGYNGLTYTLTGSSVAGLQAILVANDLLLELRADASIVVGHDALDEPLQRAAPWLDDCFPSGQLGEGACAIVLECVDSARGRSGIVQAWIGDSIMFSGNLRKRKPARMVLRRLADAIGQSNWNIIYLAGPASQELDDLANQLIRLTESPAVTKRLHPYTNHCMAADALICIAAAVSQRERALILSAEPDGVIATVCIEPAD